MKIIFKILLMVVAAACSSEDVLKTPVSGGNLDLRMTTTGGNNFKDYIHSLTIYAFVRSPEEYLFYKILARLDAEGITQLADVSDRENSKLFNTTLPIGDYELYFVANVPENKMNIPQVGVSGAPDIFMSCPDGIPEAVYFSGYCKLRVVTNVVRPVSVVLNRIVSKLVVTLYGVPESTDTIGVSVGNITSRMSLNGVFSSDTVTASAFFAAGNKNVYRGDTAVYEMLTFPTASGSSDMRLVFRSVSGQEKVEQLPPVILLPDKFVRVTVKISDPLNPDEK